ncbi:MAG: tetratricopeptide repeat protein [Elusimicrobia bacterium]|nr:tetratricopeptide repeat protein [Elusimicrobiota bacterium]
MISGRCRAALFGAALAAAVFSAYAPSLKGGFLWGEDLGGRLRGLPPAGCRAASAALHSANAWMFASAIGAMGVPGAGISALIFALHPVHAESVAWPAQGGSLLSAFFFLLSFLAYQRFLKDGGGRSYAASLLLFLCAVWSKAEACVLPAAVLLAAAFRGQRLPGWRDIKPLVPFFAAGLGLALAAVWHEASRAGSFLIAGRAPWFYLGKLLWPSPLVFVYPKWDIDSGRIAAWAFPAALPALAAFLWRMRARAASRAALFALAFFILALFPVMGLFSIREFRYSFAADRFQYLASLGPLALAGAALSLLPGRWKSAAGAALCAALFALTWSRSRAFSSPARLWGDTLSKNPSAWIAHQELGKALIDEGRAADGLGHLQTALKLYPEGAEIRSAIASALIAIGRPEQAIVELGKALSLDPGCVEARFNLGVALDALSLTQEAAAQYSLALKYDPLHAEARYNYALDLLRMGRPQEAIALLREVVRQRPIAQAYNNLGAALAMTGDTRGAQEQFQQALALAPDNEEAAANLKRLAADKKR